MLWDTAGEECRNLLTLSFFCFLTPPSRRATSPIAHTCAEEEVNAFLLNCLCSCFDFGATSRDAVGKKCKIYPSTSKGECPLTPSPIPCGIVGYSHTPPLRTYVRLGEKARRAGRLKQRWSDVLKDFFSPPCRVPWYYGVSPSNRGRRTNTIHRKVLPSSPVFCIAKYRGGVLWTEGLKKYP